MNGYNFSDASDIRLGSSTITALYYGTTLIWPKSTPPTPPTPTDWSTEYLQVEALEQLQLRNYIDTQSFDATAVYYSTNKADWYNWNKNIAVSLNTGDKVYFKGYYKASNSDVNLRQMPIAYSQGRHKVQGNIMSLLYMDNFSDKTTLNFDLSGNRIVGGATKCFNTLFQHDIGLVDASNLVLPAIRLANACYAYMFENCYNLIYSPSVLPATELSHYSGGYIVDPGDNCYWGMFYNCTSLLSTPSLPATSLASGCYKRMFAGCSALTTAPSLPAMNLASECYYQMFAGCHTLTTAPSLPARILSSSCYYGMFHLCDALTTAPELPATTLAERCYYSMFVGCTSLSYIKCLATDISASMCLYNWVQNVAATGTFVKDASATWPSGSSGIPSGWTVTDPATEHWSTEYLHVEALEPMTLTTAMPVSKTTNDILDVQYSTDKTNWNAWNADVSLSLSTGDKVYFKGSYLSTFTKINSNSSYSAKYELCGNGGGRYNVQGNIMSLIYGDNFANQYSLQGYTYCFYKLFMGNKSITDMSNLILPATTLAAYCYGDMFESCTSLTTAPVLPATELAKQCYIYMFKGCTSLTTAPALPATELGDYCYSNMFNGCKSLPTAPALPATTLKNNCYMQMFQYCTSLTTAPVLPATKLLSRCYHQMFMGCTSLNYIKCLATDMTASNCLTDWLKNVAATGTFVKDANATWASGTSGIPADWTVQDV